ncbi:D-tyrosyl-tRNA(Tyr) deacylase [Alkaliphilus sp. MSJ-5]|uniref:D-aminoacyl-tRNA deacylase n=1 Tax=Alkaliphilus flagellatus TaxID=2841507 RepID=A0ABS6G5R4_9FIRM|nr:D-aminoacyl-tRNA deacylase [Alkaliphilus flagellatus]MBU5677829.1 D-tyrosyl-tRNA(Tyr) deacylase [Alkaliphilus flagellatus]
MRAVVQRISQGKVVVEDQVTGAIDKGLLVFLGVTNEDNIQDVKYMAEKIVNLRIFEDDNEKMNLSVIDVEGKILAVSQFTLLGDCRKGRRPNFTEAARPEMADELYKSFIEECQKLGVNVETGVFQAHMMVHSINDGPVTILIDSKKTF